MKRAIVPIIFTGLALIGLGIMRARAHFYLSKNQSLTESRVERDLSLEEVQLTNIHPQADVDYKIIYQIRTYRYTKGLFIKKKIDTTGVLVSAIAACRCTGGPKPVLPKPLYWGKLDWR